MRCPRCGFQGALLKGGCALCGYGRENASSSAMPAIHGHRFAENRPGSSISRPLSLVPMPFTRGDLLHQGRYQLLESMHLPPNQSGQGMAWLAIETQSLRRMVVMREVRFSDGTSTIADEMIYTMALRLSELGRHPGFPVALDAFQERGSYFLVLQYIEGASLAQIMKQGGVLSEQTAVDFGRQLCEMLSIMSSFRPPLVHGSIGPQTIIVSPDRQRVSLIHFPLFPPRLGANDGRLAEPATDIYSLASTLYYALTAFFPDERMPRFFPPARQLNPALSTQVESFLARGLRSSSAYNYQRPLEMLIDLEAVSKATPDAAVDLQHSTPNGRYAVDAHAPAGARQPGRESRFVSTIVMIVGVFVAIILLGGILLSLPLQPGPPGKQQAPIQTHTATAAQVARVRAQAHEWTLEQQSYQQSNVAISDGRFVFDSGPGRQDVALKMQAAQALRRGDLASASALLAQALQHDPTDAEAQIYYQDLLIAQQGRPSITIVLGINFDQSASLLAKEREELQGAFFAQRQINAVGHVDGGASLLAHSVRLRLFIGSAGSSALPSNARTVAQFLANRVTQAGNLDSIVALVGWPGSSQTASALALLSALHIPVVSQGATDASLSGSSPYFFRVIPPLDVIGSDLGTLAVQQLHTKTVLVVHDPNDPESASLAAQFTAQARTFNVTIVNSPNDYFTEGETSVNDFQNVIGDILAYNADLVVLAGTDIDAVRLAHAVGIAARENPTNTLLANINILGGPAIDSSLLIGQGNNPDAAIARAYPQDMQRLSFISYADAGVYSYQRIPVAAQPALLSQWTSLFPGASVPSQDAIVTYDATVVVAKAASMQVSVPNGQSIQQALSSIGAGSVPSYLGASGRISFDAQGNPINKALVFMSVVQSGVGSAFRIKQVLGSFS